MLPVPKVIVSLRSYFTPKDNEEDKQQKYCGRGNSYLYLAWYSDQHQ